MRPINHRLKKKEKPNFFIWSIIVVALFALMWWGASAVIQKGSSWLAGTSWSILKKIEIIGTERIPDHDVLLVAAVPDNANLMELPLDSISARITAMPGIKSARAIRRLPGRLLIKVIERRAIAAVAGDQLVLVDADNVMFPLVHTGEVIDLPLVTGTGDVKGENVRKNFYAAMDLIKHVSKEYPNLKENLGEVRFEGSKLILRLRNGGAQVITRNGFSDETLEDIDYFLKERSGEVPATLAYLDLRFPAMIITGTEG